MTRREGRELAFILLFEKSFTGEAVADILAGAREARDVEEDGFALSLAQGAEREADAIDEAITAFSHKDGKYKQKIRTAKPTGRTDTLSAFERNTRSTPVPAQVRDSAQQT